MAEMVGRNNFLLRVAKTNKPELLKWAREEKQCEWDAATSRRAAYQDNLEMVKYCVANECPIDKNACANAARNGHLEVLKYLRRRQSTLGFGSCQLGGSYGHLHILEYLVERKYDKYKEWACECAARKRSLRLFEVLARNRQSALGLFGPFEKRSTANTPSVYNTSSTTTALPRRLVLRRWRVTRGRIRIRRGRGRRRRFRRLGRRRILGRRNGRVDINKNKVFFQMYDPQSNHHHHHHKGKLVIKEILTERNTNNKERKRALISLAAHIFLLFSCFT